MEYKAVTKGWDWSRCTSTVYLQKLVELDCVIHFVFTHLGKRKFDWGPLSHTGTFLTSLTIRNSSVSVGTWPRFFITTSSSGNERTPSVWSTSKCDCVWRSTLLWHKNVQNLSETCLTLTNTGLDPEGWCHCMFRLWVKYFFAFCKFSDPRPCRRAWKLPSIRPQLLSRAATHPGHWPVVMMQSQNQWLGSYQVDVDDEVILLLDHSSLSSNLPHLYWGQSSTRIIQKFNNGDLKRTTRII